MLDFELPVVHRKSDTIRAIKSTRRDVIASSLSEQNESRRRGRCSCIDMDAFGFALRISLVLTAASLFVLINPKDPYPQGSWVFVTCCVVSWFPSSMDAASVMKKTFHRILGTVLGALLALAIGFITHSFRNVQHQAIFLGLSIAFISFTLTYVVVHYSRIFGGYSYASLLVLMTFGIAVFPFYNTAESEEDVWKKGAFRIANIMIGCLISATGSMIILPKSTYKAIQQSLEEQVALAGSASQAVLESAVQFYSKERCPVALADLLAAEHGKQNENDAVYLLTKRAMEDFQKAKALFPLLRYDPFFRFRFKRSEGATFKHELMLTMNRTFRIHTTIVLLNSIIRNDQGHDFSPGQLELLERTSSLIPVLLKGVGITSTQKNSSRAYACAVELSSILGQIRTFALEAAKKLIEVRETGTTDSTRIDQLSLNAFFEQLQDPGGGQPICTHSATILFLELVEHLILRSLRLYMTMISYNGTTGAEKSKIVLDGVVNEDDDGEVHA